MSFIFALAEFFPSFRFEGDAAYFAAACESLNDTQKIQVKEEFAKTLNEKGICKKSITKVCDIKDMGIICGRTTRRRKRRGVEYTEESVDFTFNVTALKFEDKISECEEKICPMLRIPEGHCEESLCISTYKRYLQAAVKYAKGQLSALYRDPSKLKELIFRIQNIEFDPQQNGFHGSSIVTECPEGMEANEGQCGKLLFFYSKTFIARGDSRKFWWEV